MSSQDQPEIKMWEERDRLRAENRRLREELSHALVQAAEHWEAAENSRFVRDKFKAESQRLRERCERYERILYPPQTHEQADILRRAAGDAE